MLLAAVILTLLLFCKKFQSLFGGRRPEAEYPERLAIEWISANQDPGINMYNDPVSDLIQFDEPDWPMPLHYMNIPEIVIDVCIDDSFLLNIDELAMVEAVHISETVMDVSESAVLCLDDSFLLNIDELAMVEAVHISETVMDVSEPAVLCLDDSFLLNIDELAMVEAVHISETVMDVSEPAVLCLDDSFLLNINELALVEPAHFLDHLVDMIDDHEEEKTPETASLCSSDGSSTLDTDDRNSDCDSHGYLIPKVVNLPLPPTNATEYIGTEDTNHNDDKYDSEADVMPMLVHIPPVPDALPQIGNDVEGNYDTGEQPSLGDEFNEEDFYRSYPHLSFIPLDLFFGQDLQQEDESENQYENQSDKQSDAESYDQSDEQPSEGRSDDSEYEGDTEYSISA